MFLTHLNKHRTSEQGLLSSPPPADISPKISKPKVKEIRFEVQTQVAFNLSELLRLKTIQGWIQACMKTLFCWKNCHFLAVIQESFGR